MFSVLEWVYPKLPSELPWKPDWPDAETTFPAACFRVADDSTGRVTTEGEGSARVAIYTDVWSTTPEERETHDRTVTAALLPLGFVRGMRRHTVEITPDGRSLFRSTTLWSGEYDHSQERMCAPF